MLPFLLGESLSEYSRTWWFFGYGLVFLLFHFIVYLYYIKDNGKNYTFERGMKLEVKKETIGILASFLLALPLLGGGYWVINSLMNQPAKTITDQTSPQSIEEPESNVDSTHIFVKDEISITDLDDSYRYNSEEETEAMVLDDTEEDTEDNSMEDAAEVSDSIHEVNVGNENQNSSVVNSTERTNVRQENQPVQEKTNNKPTTKQPEKKDQQEKEKTTDSKNKKDDKQTSPPKDEESNTPSNPKEEEEKPTEPEDNKNEDQPEPQDPPPTNEDDPTDNSKEGNTSEEPGSP